MTPEDLLAPLDPRTRAICDRVRAVVTAAVPTFVERALPGWKAIAFHDPHAGYVCGLFPGVAEVRLYLEHGARLDDPDGLLDRTPTMKRGRFVRFASVRDVRARPLARLVRAAVALQSL